MLKILYSTLFFATAFIFSCADYPRIDEIEHTLKYGDELTDSRGGTTQKYKTVIIGNQTWIARNLNYSIGNSKCYKNLPANCATFGKLYDWATAMNLPDSCNARNTGDCSHASKHQGICPDGWRLPSDTEWQTLVEYVGQNVGVKLRATSDWSDNADNGDDDYGFSAKPSGFYYKKPTGEEIFGDMDEEVQVGHWWSSTELKDYPDQAYYRNIGEDYYKVLKKAAFKTYMFAVRCIKD